MDELLYETKFGKYLLGDSLELIDKYVKRYYKNKVQLIVTSPPFPLNKKKQYGNLQGDVYKNWFVELGKIFQELLTDDGSLVIELGNSWEAQRPIQSILHLECLLELVKSEDNDFRLIQEFVSYNPSKIPSPAQWVTVNRIRTVDSYTHAWWLAKSDFPKAENTKVLRPYSRSMKALLKRQSFNSGERPSQHKVSEEGFLKDHGGSIMHNFLELDQLDNSKEWRLPENVMSLSNASSNDFFQRQCRKHKITPHPARMSAGLASFFIEFLTDEGDLVFDPFGGSNTTGYCAERLKRKWIATEIYKEYGLQSAIRFLEPELDSNLKFHQRTGRKKIYDDIRREARSAHQN